MAISVEEKTHLCSQVAQDKKAHDLVILDLRKHSYVTDYFMICSGNSNVQVQAIADAIDDRLKQEGIRPIGKEGYPEARWILLDYSDLVIHIFHDETRRFYDLERLWGDAATIEISQLRIQRTDFPDARGLQRTFPGTVEFFPEPKG